MSKMLTEPILSENRSRLKALNFKLRRSLVHSVPWKYREGAPERKINDFSSMFEVWQIESGLCCGHVDFEGCVVQDTRLICAGFGWDKT